MDMEMEKKAEETALNLMDMEKKAEETALNSTTISETKDMESQTKPKKTRGKHRRRNICLAVTAGIIVTFVLVVVILAFTYFKAKEPTTTIDSIGLENFNAALNAPRVGVDLNITLDVDLTVTNPNKVGFKYKNGSALLNYRGELVGEVPIPAGKMGSDETRPMNVTVYVMADRLLSNPQFIPDVASGLLNVSTSIKLSGKVEIFNIFKISVSTTTTCDISFFIANITIAEQKCDYDAKL